MDRATAKSTMIGIDRFWFGRYPSWYNRLTDAQVDFVEKYAYLSHIENFPILDDLWVEAVEIFDNVVPFPMFAQRVDSYMRQSRHKEAFCLIEDLCQADGQKTSLRPHEKKTLLLIKAYCGSHVYGALRYAIQEAAQVSLWLSEIKEECKFDFEAHAVEYWLHIMKYAVTNFSYADNIPLSCPTSSVDEPKITTDQATMYKEAFEWAGLTEHLGKLLASRKLFAALSLAKIVASIVSKNWLIDCYEQLLAATSPDGWPTNIFLSIARLQILIAGMRADSLPQSIPLTSKNEDYLAAELQRLIELARCPLPRAQLELLYVRSIGIEALQDSPVPADLWIEMLDLASINKDYAITADALTKLIALGKSSETSEALCTQLDQIYEQIGEASGMLEARCYSYRPQDPENSMRMLEWFSRFDAKYPLGQTVVTGVLSSEPQEKGWDEPKSRLREEEIRTIILRSLTNPKAGQGLTQESQVPMNSPEVVQQKTALERSKHQQSVLQNFIPWKFTQHKGLSTGRFYETCVIKNTGVSFPVQNLANRIFEKCCASTSQSEPLSILLESLDIKPLDEVSSMSDLARHVQQQLFSPRRSIDDIKHKLGLVQVWIETSEILHEPGSEELVAQLKLQATIHARQTGCEPLECAAVEAEFMDYLERIDNSQLKQLYSRNQLLVDQQAVDAAMWKGTNPLHLPIIRIFYNTILKRYKDSWLSSDIGKVAVLYSRLAEVTLQLRDSEHWLQEFGSLRSNLIVMDAVETFELRANIKSSLLGQAICHKRNVSALISLCMDNGTGVPALDEEQRNQVLIQLWEVVQQGKARALLDRVRNGESGSSAQDTTPSEATKTTQHHSPLASASGHQDSPLVREWVRRRDRLALLRVQNPHNTVAVAQARAEVVETEHQIESENDMPALYKMLKQQNISLSDMSQLIQQKGENAVLVDWFAADVTGAEDVLFALTARIGSSWPPTLKVHRLGSDIEVISSKWVTDYIAGETQIPSDAAWEALPLLQPLVQFLKHESDSEETLIFCPTSIHALDRIPLHALRLGVETTFTEDILLCRNRIVYTYSHSVLADALLQENKVPAPESSRSHLIVSPVANHDMPAPPGVNIDTKGFGTECTNLSHFTTPSATVITDKQATRPQVLASCQDVSSFLFAGFVHGSPTGDPLQTHLMLYDSDICAPCPSKGHVDADSTTLSASDIIASLSLAHGALVTLLACDSGVPGATAPDEPLGLVAAMIYAGAGSTISTLWKIDTGVAQRWMYFFSLELRLLQRANKMKRLKGLSATGSEWMDGAELLRKVCLKIMGAGRSRVQDWAPYVFHGRWRMPML